jgi:hypothetical protein
VDDGEPTGVRLEGALRAAPALDFFASKYGNRQASFRKDRKDYRGKRFKAEYNRIKKAAAAKAKKAGKAKKSKGS